MNWKNTCAPVCKPAKLENVINAVGQLRRSNGSQDSLLEDALRQAGKSPVTLLCPWNEYIEGKLDDHHEEPSEQNPLVFHLFGRWDSPTRSCCPKTTISTS